MVTNSVEAKHGDWIIFRTRMIYENRKAKKKKNSEQKGSIYGNWSKNEII